MSLSAGYLGPGQVPASFKETYIGRRTGVLRFRRDGSSCGVSFVGGHVAYAEAGRGQLRLAERMAARGLLDREDRKRGTEQALREGRRVGETLVSLGVIDRAALRQAMALHAKEIVAELLAWTEGSITFEPRDRRQGRYEEPLALSTAQLVVDASRVITDHDVFAAGLDGDVRIAVASEPLLRLQRLRWSFADRIVVECAAGGRRSAREIVREVPLPATEAERIISTLLWVGVLEPARGQHPSPPFEREIPSRSEVLGLHRELSSEDPFGALGLSREANDSELEDAYARLAQRFHPDAQHEPELEDLGEPLEAIFVRVTAAYEALTESRSRPPRAAREAGGSRVAPQSPAPLLETMALELQPLDASAAETQLRYARERIAQGAYFEGVALLRELLIRAPDAPTRAEARRQLALAYLDSPRTAVRARAELERAVVESPGDIELRVLLARAHVRLGNAEAARATLKLALEMDPDHADARSALEKIQL